MNYFWLVTIAATGMVLGNLLVRAGMLQRHVSLGGLWSTTWRVSIGTALLVVGFLGWLFVTLVWPNEWGYTVLGLSYLATIVCAWWFLGETLTLEKMFGCIILVIGLILIIRNSIV
jgi:hypothetical protein